MFHANAVQVKVSIDEIEPNVWRRLVLPVHWNLEHLHLGIQAAFNWWNYHLYEFRIGGLRYGDVEILSEDATDDDPRVFDQKEVRLLDFEQGSVFSYHYDFGDGWRHTVVVEEFLTLASTPTHGSCVAGARARPPEDVGGDKRSWRVSQALFMNGSVVSGAVSPTRPRNQGPKLLHHLRVRWTVNHHVEVRSALDRKI